MNKFYDIYGNARTYTDSDLNSLCIQCVKIQLRQREYELNSLLGEKVTFKRLEEKETLENAISNLSLCLSKLEDKKRIEDSFSDIPLIHEEKKEDV